MHVQVLKTNEVKVRWREVVDAAQVGHTDTVVERHGKPVAVVIPHADYVALQEELEDIRDARLALSELEALRNVNCIYSKNYSGNYGAYSGEIVHRFR